jgi:hypothetical protein
MAHSFAATNTEQDAAEHTEYCGIGANTQGKSEDGNCREGWGFAQCTQCVTSVLQNDFDERYSTRIAAFLLDLVEPAKRQPVCRSASSRDMPEAMYFSICCW